MQGLRLRHLQQDRTGSLKAGEQDPKTLLAVAKMIVLMVGEHEVATREGDDYLVRRDPFIDLAYFLAARAKRNDKKRK